MTVFLLLLLCVHDDVHMYLSLNDCIAGGCLWAVGALLTFLRSIQVHSSASFALLLPTDLLVCIIFLLLPIDLLSWVTTSLTFPPILC